MLFEEVLTTLRGKYSAKNVYVREEDEMRVLSFSDDISDRKYNTVLVFGTGDSASLDGNFDRMPAGYEEVNCVVRTPWAGDAYKALQELNEFNAGYRGVTLYLKDGCINVASSRIVRDCDGVMQAVGTCAAVLYLLKILEV